jgi:xanthine dehydrogenase iron-sulfur cluster and FAD-binding subunit A
MKKIIALLMMVPLLAIAQTNVYNILDRNAPTIIGGTVNGATIGATTPASIASTTTVYLVAQCAFSLGTNVGYGTIRARRVR